MMPQTAPRRVAVAAGRLRIAGRLRSETALCSAGLFPLVCGVVFFALAAPAQAACTTSGGTTTCPPGIYRQVIGTGYGDDNVHVTVGDGTTVSTGDNNAITLGNNAVIDILDGGTVENYAVHNFGDGNYGIGANTIEVDSNSRITIQAGGSVKALGTETEAEAINPFGVNNVIDNYGTLYARNAAVIWFQTPSGPNTVINEASGVMTTGVAGGSILGQTGVGSVDFIDKGTINGNLDFGGGNDTLHLSTTYVINHGTIDGGGGTNTIFLNGAGTATMDGSLIIDFSNLTKQDSGTWTLTGTVGNSDGQAMAVDVQAGTLLLGDETGQPATLSNGPVTVESGATFGGYGRVNGDVTNDGRLTVGNASPAFAAGPAGIFTINGTLTNAGRVWIGGSSVGNQLVVNNYVGQNGVVVLHTELGSDNSPTDQLVINGGTASGTTNLRIVNVGGSGALTAGNGIEVVVAENGATINPGAFTLEGGSIRAGAYDYRLFQGTGASADNFYLRDAITSPSGPTDPTDPTGPTSPTDPTDPSTPSSPTAPADPTDPDGSSANPGDPAAASSGAPILGPELSAYGAAIPTAQQLGLDALGTLYDRIGDETIGTNSGSAATWGRAFGGYIGAGYGGLTQNRTSGSEAGMQVGFDLFRNRAEDGARNFFGTYFSYANANVGTSGLVTNAAGTENVMAKTGNDSVNAYSGGLYYTHFGPSGWYADLVAQGTHYTGSAASTLRFR